MKKSTSTALHWTYSFSKPYLWGVVLLALIGASISGGFILLAVVSSAILDSATGARDGGVWYWIGLLLIIIVLQSLLHGVASQVRARISGRMEMNLRQMLFSTLNRKQYNQLYAIHSGDIVNRLSSDVQVVVNGVVQLLPQLISMSTKLIAGFIVLMNISPIFSLVIAGGGLVMYGSGRLYRLRYKTLHKKCQSTEGQTRSFIQECMENIIVIKSFCKEHLIHQKLEERQQANYRAKLQRNMVTATATTSSYLMVSLGYFAVLAWGAFQLSAGAITFGALLAFLQIMEQIKAPFRNMSGLTPQYYAMLASAERLQELEQLQDESTEANYVQLEHVYTELKTIECDQLTFSYESDPLTRYVFYNTQLTIHKGEFVGIAGASGSGKSTLLQLILGLVQPGAGEISLLLRNGSSVPGIVGRLLYAYVPQTNLMFSGTIRDNLTMFNVAVNDSDIEHALYIACLSEDITDFPDGLDTVLGERNIGLSEGQAQRLSIARAVISGAPILLLDECTSALNRELEKEVLHRLRLLKERTVIFVSHSVSALIDCDRVIDLDRLKHRKEVGHGA